MRAIVMDMKGANRRECLVSDATPTGCRLSGNVDGLPDLLSIAVAGVAQPMKGRVVSRAPGSLDVELALRQAAEPKPGPEEEETVAAGRELDMGTEADPPPIPKPAHSSAALSDEEVMKIFFRLEKSLLARLG